MYFLRNFIRHFLSFQSTPVIIGIFFKVSVNFWTCPRDLYKGQSLIPKNATQTFSFIIIYNYNYNDSNAIGSYVCEKVFSFRR